MSTIVSDVEVVGAGTVPEESSKSATSWGSVVAGGVAAAALTLVLVMVGSGLGLTMVSPYGENPSLQAATVGTAIWLVITQWLSALLGGYLAGRLRTKWVNLHTDEVFFRDTAHGFLAWALATLLVAGLLSSTISAMVGTGVQAAANVAGGAAMGGAAAAASDSGPSGDTTGYFVDALLRPADPANPAQNPEQASAEISRILLAGAAAGKMEADDRAYLDQLVAARTGLSPADAKARVDAVLQRADAAAAQAKDAADKARQAGAAFALAGALSLVIGAFIASAAAALGGRLRDDNEGALNLRD